MIKPDSIWGSHFLYPEPVNFPEQESIARNALVLAAVLDNSYAMPNEMSSIKIVRAMLANMLVKSGTLDEFSNYSQDHGWGIPKEKDREETQNWLEWYASVSGLLHAYEIDWLSHYISGRVPAYIDNVENYPKPLENEELSETTQAWTNKGYTVAAFQGSFDAPTSTHLTNATFAHLWAQDQGIKIKLIWWFDNDSLIKRKCTTRPRFRVDERRSSVNGLWQVPATAISSAETTSDESAYIHDYLSTTTKIVFVTDDEPLPPQRIGSATKAGAKIVTLPGAPNSFHSSDKMWRTAK